MKKVGIVGIVLIALVFLCMPVLADFNTSSNQNDLNWRVYATTPVNLASTTGNFWVNWSWDVGTGRIPATSWNVSINGTWHNDTGSSYYNQSTVAHGWVNISVWGYNSTDGVLSESSIDGQQQIPNNAPVITNCNDWSGTGIVSELVELDFGYTDLDGDVCIFSTTATKGSLDTTTGVFIWQTEAGDNGVYNWQFNVSDGYGSTDNCSVTITLGEVTLNRLIDTTITSYALLGILGIVFLVTFILSILFAIHNSEEINYTAILVGFVMLLGFFVLLYVMLPLFDTIISAMGG